MGTPNEETWPGVSKLKDFKPTFPQWNDNVLKDSVSNIKDDGVDLMQVISNNQLLKSINYLFLSIFLCF